MGIGITIRVHGVVLIIHQFVQGVTCQFSDRLRSFFRLLPLFNYDAVAPTAFLGRKCFLLLFKVKSVSA